MQVPFAKSSISPSWSRSLRVTRKNTSPIMDPWGSSYTTGNDCQYCPWCTLTLSICFLFVKYDLKTYLVDDSRHFIDEKFVQKLTMRDTVKSFAQVSKYECSRTSHLKMCQHLIHQLQNGRHCTPVRINLCYVGSQHRLSHYKHNTFIDKLYVNITHQILIFLKQNTHCDRFFGSVGSVSNAKLAFCGNVEKYGPILYGFISYRTGERQSNNQNLFGH